MAHRISVASSWLDLSRYPAPFIKQFSPILQPARKGQLGVVVGLGKGITRINSGTDPLLDFIFNLLERNYFFNGIDFNSAILKGDGYFLGRYRDRNYVAFQMEYGQYVTPKLGFVAYGDRRCGQRNYRPEFERVEI
ncbi:hypothetical protein LVD13_09770 [Flavobacteriaceae bacterium D16]|nr:hypothetical protein [Flavobacteriaceae bacterium D16]